MKQLLLKITFLMLFLSCLSSCNKDLEENQILNDDLHTLTRSENIVTNPIDQLIDIPINIVLSNPPFAYKYLGYKDIPGSAGRHSGITLSENNLGINSQWMMEKGKFQGYDCYVFRFMGSTPGQIDFPDHFYLSVADNMSSLNRYPINDAYNGYFVIIQKEGENDKYYISHLRQYTQGFRGPVSIGAFLREGPPQVMICTLKYTMEEFEGVVDEKLKTFEFQPVEAFEIVNMEYVISPGDLVTAMPEFITTAFVINNSSVEQSMTMAFSEKATESSRFSRTQGVSVQISGSVNVGIPEFNASGSITQTTSDSWSFENSQSKEDSRTYNFPLRVPPYTKMNAVASVARYSADITYIVTLRGKTSGKILRLSGVWSGVKAGTVTYSIWEGNENNKKIVKTFTGIPDKEIDLHFK